MMLELLIERLIEEGKITQEEINRQVAEIKANAIEAPPSMESMIAITELAEMQLESTLALEMALAEIAEIVLGGMN